MRFVPSNMGFNPEVFRKVFSSQPPDVQQAMKDKAVWEHMSLSAVMKDYYPDLWKQVHPGPPNRRQDEY